MPRYIKKRQEWLSRRDKAVVSLLEKTHFGALLKFKVEVKFFTSLDWRLISYLLVLSGGVIKIRESDYLTDIMLLNLSLKVQCWIVVNGNKLFVRWWFKGRLVKKSEKYNSHRNNAFVSSLEDTHLGPMLKLKTEVEFFTSLWRRLISWLFVR